MVVARIDRLSLTTVPHNPPRMCFALVAMASGQCSSSEVLPGPSYRVEPGRAADLRSLPHKSQIMQLNGQRRPWQGLYCSWMGPMDHFDDRCCGSILCSRSSTWPDYCGRLADVVCLGTLEEQAHCFVYVQSDDVLRCASCFT